MFTATHQYVIVKDAIAKPKRAELINSLKSPFEKGDQAL